jgi:hypothetical protein
MKTRFVLLVCLAAFAALGGSAFAAASQGEITYMEGQVTIDRVPASIGDLVPLGATVRTEKLSQCEIVFRQRNILRLAEETALVFNPGNLQTGSSLQKGALSLVLKNLVPGASGDHSFFVRTPTAAAGVRGTSFFMKVEDAHTTYVCLCNGAIALSDGSPPGRTPVEAAHHASWRIIEDRGATTVIKAPMLYHTDADMEGLAERIGVSIDWNSIDR